MVKKTAALNYIGGIGSVILGKFCPICYPAVGFFLASIGFSFAAITAVLKGLLIIFLAIGLLGLWRSGRVHRKPWPVLCAIPSAVLIYAGKYIWPVDLLFYGGILGLVIALILDISLVRAARVVPSCPACK